MDLNKDDQPGVSKESSPNSEPNSSLNGKSETKKIVASKKTDKLPPLLKSRLKNTVEEVANLLSPINIVDDNRITIRNLSHRVNQDHLNEIFGKYGPIANIDLKEEFAVIEYETFENSQEAIKKMDQGFIDSKQILVEPYSSEKQEEIVLNL
ncbi:unnamed protein product [Dimorphilus gyrociliatus]|uniref:RRM domain-containing protein n=1 Tax=Dimorphilus gyrociliatus TaxID=2664684 RepID=A0A7I8VYE6_9ANNE|nr:unnamed protein product [Dimorphilus gyrociliatus]